MFNNPNNFTPSFNPKNGEHVIIRYADNHQDDLGTNLSWIGRGVGDKKGQKIFWSINFEFPEKIFLIEEEGMVPYDIFVIFLRKKYPEDLDWILFHPEILSGKFNQ
jgi:hypothetical protein